MTTPFAPALRMHVNNSCVSMSRPIFADCHVIYLLTASVISFCISAVCETSFSAIPYDSGSVADGLVSLVRALERTPHPPGRALYAGDRRGVVRGQQSGEPDDR